MPNPENLRPKPFTSENQPANRGRKKGSVSRATLLKRWLEMPIELLNPISKLKEKGKVQDEVILALIAKARQGDVAAIKEVLDGRFGKIPANITIDAAALDAEIERRLALLAIGSQGEVFGEVTSEAAN